VFTNQLFLDKTSMHYLPSVAATHLDSSLRISVWQGGNHDVTVTALGKLSMVFYSSKTFVAPKFSCFNIFCACILSQLRPYLVMV